MALERATTGVDGHWIGASGPTQRVSDPPRISAHAVDRYIERVKPSASRDEARWCIAWTMAHGQIRSTPRHWMRTRAWLTPGLRFVYWAGQADVCLLVLEGVVITVTTRALCRRGRVDLVEEGIWEPVYMRAGSLGRSGFGTADFGRRDAA